MLTDCSQGWSGFTSAMNALCRSVLPRPIKSRILSTCSPITYVYTPMLTGCVGLARLHLELKELCPLATCSYLDLSSSSIVNAFQSR